MPPKVQKSKAAKLLAAQSSSKARKTKKKSKLREKKNHRVVFTQALLDGALASAAKKARVITIYSIIEQYKITGSLARKLLQELSKTGAIKVVSKAGPMTIWTSAKAEAE